MQAGIGGPDAFLGNGETDGCALVDQVPGADVEVRTDDRFAALEGVGRGARAVEEQRRIQRAELAVERGEVGPVDAPDIGQEEHERHAGRVGGRGQGDGAGVFRLPQVLPAGGRLLHFVGVVGQAERVEARADRIGVPVACVDCLVHHVLQVGNGGRVEVGEHAGGMGELADAAIHPGHVDGRIGFLLLEFRQGGGGGADFRGYGNSGCLGEGLGDAAQESLAPVAAVECDGEFVLLRHGACRGNAAREQERDCDGIASLRSHVMSSGGVVLLCPLVCILLVTRLRGLARCGLEVE
ncbi:hypothetical protein D3C85_1132550 [compost metagenome]